MTSEDNIASRISEPLTWAEICKRYPEQWVILVEFDRIDPSRFAFRTARVVGHSKQRRDAIEQARPWWRMYEELGQEYTGPEQAPSIPRCVVRIDLPWNPVPRFY